MWTLQSPDDGAGGTLTLRLRPGSSRTIGRAPAADFVVDAPLISRLHCRVVVSGAGLLEVEDLDSTNGTWVNDRRVTRSVLVAGDRLRVGRVELAVTKAAP
jgi:pSer/pThr/pTyr-binding forkhead associated (FHA) protein